MSTTKPKKLTDRPDRGQTFTEKDIRPFDPSPEAWGNRVAQIMRKNPLGSECEGQKVTGYVIGKGKQSIDVISH